MSSSRGKLATDALIVFGVAALYVACAKLGLALAFRSEQVTVVWPPTGFALAVVVLLGRRSVPGILAGAFIANVTTGAPAWVAAGIATGNTLEALAGAAILKRLKFDAALARLRDVLSLFAAVTSAPFVSATIGVLFLVAGRLHVTSDAPVLWSVWWLGDALGGLIIAPLILVWAKSERRSRAHGSPLEPVLVFLGVIAAAGLVFSLPPNYSAAYLVYPFLIWAALRLGPAYTTTASLLANAIAVFGTLSGRGPFVGAGPEEGLVMVQIFMAVGAATALILGAVAAEGRRAHERAEVSEHRLQMAMAGARVGVWDWNIGSGEILWSEGLEPMHGLPRGGFAGNYEAYQKMVHPEDREHFEALISRSLETRAPYEAEFRLLGQDGVLRWISARGIVLDDAEGRAARMIGVGIDVTQQKEYEEELRLQHRRKDEFLAMLAHELRNPLAAIVHAVDLLRSDDSSEREQAQGVIGRQTRNLSRMVDDLLDVSRITRGQITLERHRVKLADVVNSGAEIWGHLVSQKRQRLEIEVPGTLWTDGDPTRLTQVFANLIHNAAKFTPDEGVIRVFAREEEGSAAVHVRDEGHGMSADVLAHAFELFVQGPSLLDRQHGGLGLGLTLVRRLVEMHGGAVEARSEGKDRGTEIVVRLPLAAAPEAVVEPQPVRKIGSQSSRRVLVVEDNPDTREMLVFLLKRSGHEVRSAADGLAAIAEANAFAPQVVLLDIGLPGLDGYAVARALRSSPHTATALIVALTGYGQTDDRERAFAAGCDHHMLKPADPAEVLELVRREKGEAGVEAEAS